MRRNRNAIRQEVIQCSVNFLSERLCVEQDQVMQSMRAILEAKTVSEMIDAGTPLVQDLFPGEVTSFADCICEQWDTISSLPILPESTDRGCALSTRLRQYLRVSRGTFQKLLAAIYSLAPHSMQTERAVSHYNTVRSTHRLSTNLDTVNCRLAISMNGKGTAFYDPRPAVVKFLMSDRRLKLPEPTTYKQREFVSKFFRERNCL